MALLVALRRASSSSTLLARSFSRIPNAASAAAAAAAPQAITNRSVTYVSSPIVDSGHEDNCIINAYGGDYDRSEEFNLHHGIMDDKLVNPFQKSGSRGAFEARKVENGLFLRMEMPGISKENVKIWVEYGNVYVKGEGKKEHSHDESGRIYDATIECTGKLQPGKMDAELKNGVLRMVIPKAERFEGSDRKSSVVVK